MSERTGLENLLKVIQIAVASSNDLHSYNKQLHADLRDTATTYQIRTVTGILYGRNSLSPAQLTATKKRPALLDLWNMVEAYKMHLFSLCQHGGNKQVGLQGRIWNVPLLDHSPAYYARRVDDEIAKMSREAREVFEKILEM